MSRLFVDRISPYQSGSVTVDGLNIDTGSLVTTASFNAYTSSNDSKVNSLIASTGSFASTSGGNNFVDNQDIVGVLTVSSSNTYDIDVTGRVKIGNIANTGTNSAQLLVSASAYYGEVTPSKIDLLRASGGGAQMALTFGGYISTYTSDFTEIAIVADGSQYTSNWTQGPAISLNNPGDAYPAIIGFQNKSNWTDGRSTFLTPVKLNDVLEIAQQDPLPTGSVGQLSVSGSNLYYHNGSSWSQIN